MTPPTTCNPHAGPQKFSRSYTTEYPPTAGSSGEASPFHSRSRSGHGSQGSGGMPLIEASSQSQYSQQYPHSRAISTPVSNNPTKQTGRPSRAKAIRTKSAVARFPSSTSSMASPATGRSFLKETGVPKPHICLWTNSDNDPPCTSAFARNFDRRRHMQTHWAKEDKPRFPCPEAESVSWCDRMGDKSFDREDHRDQHRRKVHMIDIPKKPRGIRAGDK